MKQKKRWRWLAPVGLTVVAVLVAAGFALFGGDPPLPVQDSIANVGGSYWLLTDKGTDARPKPYRIATFTPLRGFSHNEQVGNPVTPTEPLYQMEPDQPESPLYAYVLRGTNRKTDALSRAGHDNIRSLYTDVGALQTRAFAGREGYYFFASGMEAFPAGEAAFLQDLFVYLPASRDSSVMIDISLRLENASQMLPEADLLRLADEIAMTLTFD